MRTATVETQENASHISVISKRLAICNFSKITYKVWSQRVNESI